MQNISHFEEELYAPVLCLHSAHKLQVPRKDLGDQRLRLLCAKCAHHAQAVQKRRKRRLVTGAVVDACRITCAINIFLQNAVTATRAYPSSIDAELKL